MKALLRSFLSISIGILAASASLGQSVATVAVPIPQVRGPLLVAAENYPFAAANKTQYPLDLAGSGYVEEEFLMSGTANVYDWVVATGFTEAKQLAFETWGSYWHDLQWLTPDRHSEVKLPSF